MQYKDIQECSVFDSTSPFGQLYVLIEEYVAMHCKLLYPYVKLARSNQHIYFKGICTSYLCRLIAYQVCN